MRKENKEQGRKREREREREKREERRERERERKRENSTKFCACSKHVWAWVILELLKQILYLNHTLLALELMEGGSMVLIT